MQKNKQKNKQKKWLDILSMKCGAFIAYALFFFTTP